MLKKITQDKPLLFIWIFFIIFALINSIFILPRGDDFIWAVSMDFERIIGPKTQNGRYFTSILTYFMERIPLLRIIIMTLFTAALPAVMCKLVDNSGKKFVASAAPIFMLFIIPYEISKQTIYWIAGFTNYVIGAVFSLSYICICLPLFNGKYEPLKKRWAIVTAILGFLGSLCVENVTIFNVLLAVFIVVFSFVNYKKVDIAHIVYFISTAVAAALMAFSSSYSSIISEEEDDFGLRFTEFGLPDMMMKIFNEILPLFSRRFYVLHIIIALSILIIYNKKFKDTESKKRPKYAKLFIPIISAYAAFSFFSCNISYITAVTPSYRIFAVETAFTFLYIVGLIYMFYCIGGKSDFIRRTIFVAGTVIMIAPFVVVNPVSGRCFFLSAVFWCLIAADCTVSAVKDSDIKNMGYLKTVGTVFVGFICITVSCIAVTNKFIENVRVNYINEQLEKGKNNIYVIELPYVGFYGDGIKDLFSGSEYDYDDESVEFPDTNKYPYRKDFCTYYNVDEAFLEGTYTWISTLDYYE